MLKIWHTGLPHKALRAKLQCTIQLKTLRTGFYQRSRFTEMAEEKERIVLLNNAQSLKANFQHKQFSYHESLSGSQSNAR